MTEELKKFFSSQPDAVTWICSPCQDRRNQLQEENSQLLNENNSLKEAKAAMKSRMNHLELEIRILKSNLKNEALSEIRGIDRELIYEVY